jgi:hypothetical protein
VLSRVIAAYGALNSSLICNDSLKSSVPSRAIAAYEALNLSSTSFPYSNDIVNIEVVKYTILAMETMQ